MEVIPDAPPVGIHLTLHADTHRLTFLHQTEGVHLIHAPSEAQRSSTHRVRSSRDSTRPRVTFDHRQRTVVQEVLRSNFLRINAGEYAGSVVHVKLDGDSSGIHLVTLGVASSLTAHIALHGNLIYTSGSTLNLLPYIPVVAVPRLEAVVSLANSCYHCIVVLSTQRSRSDVTARDTGNRPAFGSTARQTKLEVGIIQPVCQVSTLFNLSCIFSLNSIHHLLNVLDGSLNLLISQSNFFQDAFFIVFIKPVSQIVSSQLTVIIT